MRKIVRLLTLVAAFALPWAANAQSLSEYTFATGISTSHWVTLTSYTDLCPTAPSSGDSWASPVQSIGFSFPFGEEATYTQFSVNSDGNLRLGSTATGTGSYTSPFSSSNANSNSPKINFFGCDGYLVYGTHYIHSQLFGDTMLVVEYCLGPYSSAYRNNQLRWQIHLFRNGNIEAVFGNNAGLTWPYSHQMGFCENASAGWIVNSSNQASYFTSGSSTSWSSDSWPETGRYYKFFRPMITCPKPAAIAVSGITSTTATVHFTPGGNETSWIGTITPGIMGYNTIALNDTTANLMMLTPSTEYTVGVRALCGAGDTSLAREITFRTACTSLTLADLPYTEDFETYGSGYTESISPCWAKGTNNYNEYPYPTTNAAINGNRGLYFYSSQGVSSTSYYSYAALPYMASTVDVSGLTLRFNAKRYSSVSTTYRSLIQVGVMTDPNDVSTFVPVETIDLTPETANSVHPFEVSLANYAGTGKCVALMAPVIDTTGYAYNYIYIDDVELIVTPTCPRPNHLAASLGALGGTLSWTPGASGQTEFQVAFGTGTDMDNMTMGYTSNPTAYLSGLTPNTTYHFFVRAICGNGDTSDWSQMLTVSTPIIPEMVTAAEPFSDTFDAGSNWQFIHGATNQWYTGGNFGNPGGALYISNDNGTSNAYTTNVSQWSYAIKPFILTEGVYHYSFDWKAYGESSFDYIRAFLAPADAQVTAGMSPTGSTSTSGFTTTVPTGWVALDGASKLNLASTWQSRSGSITINSTLTYNVIFLWVNDGSSGTQPPAVIDNFSITRDPDTVFVTVAANNAAMGTTAPAPGNYNYLVGDTLHLAATPAAGYQFDNWTVTVGMELIGTTTVDNFSIPLTDDYARVHIVFTASFSEIDTCTVELPLTYGFESSEGFTTSVNTTSTNVNPFNACWRNEETVGTTGRLWGIRNSATFAHSGTQSLMLSDKYSNTTTLLAFPRMNITSTNGTTVGFWILRNGNDNDFEGFRLYANTTDTIDANAVDLGLYSRNYTVAAPDIQPTSGWYYYEANFNLTGTVYLMMEGHSTYINATYVDDIEIYATPTCRKPNAPVASNVTTHTADISWTLSDTTEQQFVLAYGTGSNPELMAQVNVTGTSTTLQYLQADSRYNLFVKAVCGDNDESEWSPMGNFLTNIDCGVDYEQMNATIGNGISASVSYAFFCSTTQTEGTNQAIYTADEILEAAPLYPGNNTLKRIRLHVGSMGGILHGVHVYMKNVSRDRFSGSTDSNAVTDMQEVFSGTLVCTANQWVDIPFSSPFAYNADSNLTITFRRDSVCTSGTPSFYFNTTNNIYRNIYGYRNDYTDDGYVLNSVYCRPDIELQFCSEIPSCLPLYSVSAGNISATTADITLDPNSETQNQFQVAYGTGTDPSSMAIVNLSSTNGTLYGLTPNTQYSVRARAVCGVGDTSTWSRPISFHTPCLPASGVLMSENFDLLSDYDIPACWSMGWFYQNPNEGVKTQPFSNTASIRHGDTGRSLYLLDQGVGTLSYLSTQMLPFYQSGKHALSVWVYRSSTYSTKMNEGLKFWLTDYPNDTTGGTLLGYVHRYYAYAPAESAGNEWYNYQYEIPADYDKYILIEGISEYGNATYFDDMEIILASCVENAHYAEDFEHQENDMVASCWDNSGSTSLTVTGSSATPERVWGVFRDYDSNNKMLRMYNSLVQSGTALVNSPVIVLDDTARMLRYDFSHRASCGYAYLKVSNDGGNTFVTLDTMEYDYSSYNSFEPGLFETHTVDLSSYMGDSIILQLFANANYGSGAIFVDNLEIVQYNSCADLLSLTAFDLSPTAIGIDWTPGDTAQHSFTVAYGTTDDLNAMDTVNVAGHYHYDILGLNPSTTYYIYARANCDNEPSFWRGPVTFTTPCNAFSVNDSTPFVENFETTSPSRDCWTTESFGANEFSLTTSFYGSLPFGEYCTASTGNSSTGSESYLYSPWLSVSDYGNGVDLKFKYMNPAWDSDQNILCIYVSSNGYQWEWLASYSSDASNWVSDSLRIPASACGPDMRILFLHTNYYGHGVALDDISVSAISSCPPPTNLTAYGITDHEATISWTPADSTSDNATLAFGVVDGSIPSPSNMSTLSVTGSSASLTNLASGTEYCVYVRTDCDDSASSSWSQYYTFTTEFCPTAQQCGMAIVMEDSYGDGWDNASLQVIDSISGHVWTYACDGSSDTAYMNFCDGRTYQLYWVSGYYDYECSFVLLNGNGDTVYNGSNLSSGLLASFNASCGAPADPVYVTLTVNDAAMGTTSPAPGSHVLHVGDSVTALATANDGYQFDYWELSLFGTSLGTFTDNPVSIVLPNMLANMSCTVTAHFSAMSLDPCLLSLPLTYGFEASEGFTTTASTTYTSVNPFDSCWRNEETIGATGRLWGIRNSASYAHSGSQSLMLSDKTSGTTTLLAFPPMSFTGTHGTTVSFWIYRNASGTNMEGFRLYANTTDTIDGNAVDLGFFSRYYGAAAPDVKTASGWYYYETNINLTGTVYLMMEGHSLYGNATYVDDIEIYDTPSCLRPTDVTAADITTTGATVSWTPADTAQHSFTVAYGIGTNPDSMATVSTTGTYAFLFGLSPNTVYNVFVKANCDDGDSYWSAMGSFRTACAILTADDLPYTEGFEDYGTGSAQPISPCWTKGTNNTIAYPYPTTTSVNGLRSLYFYSNHPSSASGTAYYCYAALPELDSTVDVSGLTLRFNAKRYSLTTANYRSIIQVGVMTDPTDVSTFSLVETVNLTHEPGSSVHAIEVNLASYAGSGKFVTFLAPAIDTTATAYNYIYVDDVELLSTPTCLRPTDVVASNVTSSSATLSWTPAVATHSNFTVAYGTGTDPSLMATVNVSGTTATLSGLLPSTAYNAFVRVNCGTESSEWSTLCTFITGCVALTYADLPYTEDFEDYGTGSTQPISPCWTKGTNSSTAYPYPYSAAAINGTRGLYFYSYHPSSATATAYYSYAALPELAGTVDVADLTLRFNAKRYTSTTATYRSLIQVGVMTDPSDITTFSLVETVNLTHEAASSVHAVEVNLADYAGSGKYVTFYSPVVDTTGTAYNYIYLDDVELLVTPTCPRPTNVALGNVSSNGATVTWTPANSSQTSFTVAYGTGTDPDSMATVNVSGNSANLSGLTPNTAYHLFVRGICGTENGEWSLMASFHTTMTPFAITASTPFNDDFEGSSEWQLLNDATNQWHLGTSNGNNGGALYITNDNGLTNAYTINAVQWSYALKTLSMPAGNYTYSFDWKAKGEGSYDYIRAFLVPTSVTLQGGVSPTGSTPYNFRSENPAGWIPLDGGNKLNDVTTWQTRTDSITLGNDAIYNLVFIWANDGSSGTQPPAAIDNISISLHATTPVYVNLTINDNTLGYTSPAPGSYTFAVGDTITAAATASEGCQFDYWVVSMMGMAIDSVTTNPIVFQVPSALANMSFNITAHFSRQAVANPCLLELPLAYGFEAPEGFTISTSSINTTVNPFDSCWRNEETVGTTGKVWGIKYGASYAHTGNQSLMLSDKTSGTTTLLAFPPMNFTGTHGTTVGFWLYRNASGTNMEGFRLYANTTDTITADAIDLGFYSRNTEVAGPVAVGTTGWYYYEVNVNLTGTVYLMMEGHSFYGNATYVDDIEIFSTSSCPRPTDVTASTLSATSATISWTPGESTQNSFVVAYGSGTDPDSMATVTSTSASATLTGLTPETSYNVYVKALCGSDEQSVWSQPSHLFTGYCQPAPTSVDGQGIANVTFGSGTETVNNSLRPTSAPYYGNYHYLTGGYAAGSQAEVDITYATGYTYGTVIWVDWDNNLSFDGDEVVYVGTSTNTNPTVLSATFPIPATTDTGTYRMRIAGADSYYDSYTGSIAAAYSANPCPTSSYTIVHDYSLHVSEAPSCSAPYNVAVSGIGSHTATVSWTPAFPSDNSFRVVYNDGTDADSVTVSGTSATLTGLSSNTGYTVAVRALCSATDISPLSSTATFYTLCDAFAVTDTTPFVEQFETTSPTLDCWTMERESGAPLWTLASSNSTNGYPSYGGSGLSAYCNGSGTHAVSTLISPVLDLTGSDSATLSFVYLNPSWAGDQNELTVKYRNGANGTWTTLGYYDTDVTSWTPVTLTIPTVSSALQVAFFADDEYGYCVGLDSVVVAPAQAAIVLPDVTVILATANAAMGTTSPAPGTYTFSVGDTMSANAIPATGHHFTHWTILMGPVAGVDTHATITEVVSALLAGDTLSVTANFAANTYAITVAANNSTMGTVTGGGTYNYGATATLTATAAAHHHFVQWNDGDTHAVRTVTVTGNATYTATFARNPLTVTLAINNSAMGSTTPAAGTYTFNVGDTMTATATPATGHHFVNWNVSAGIYSYTDTHSVITEVVPVELAGQSITVTANFAVNTYTLTVLSNNDAMGTVTGGGTYNYGTAATLTATAAEHYHLVQWIDGDTHVVRTVTVTGDATYTATFAIDMHTIEVTANDDEMGYVEGAGTYAYGTDVEISATANEGFVFAQWDDGDTHALRTITVTSDMAFEAQFTRMQPLAELHVVVNDSTMGYVLINGEAISDYYGHIGDVVTLTAVPTDASYRFVGWEGTDQSLVGDTITFTLVADNTIVYANFEYASIGIDDVEVDDIILYSERSRIVVRGAEQQSIRVYDAVGRLVAQRSHAAADEAIAMPATGVYLVQVGDKPARRVVVRR